MAGYSYFVCPVEFNSDTNRFMVDCEPPELFQLQEYHIPAVLQSFIGWVRTANPNTTNVYTNLYILYI